jgi:hypothetical protein
VSTPADWLARLDPGDATILDLIPNTDMDRLSAEDRERLGGLLAQEHTYRQHAATRPPTGTPPRPAPSSRA